MSDTTALRAAIDRAADIHDAIGGDCPASGADLAHAQWQQAGAIIRALDELERLLAAPVTERDA